jgi:hypothetical protein
MVLSSEFPIYNKSLITSLYPNKKMSFFPKEYRSYRKNYFIDIIFITGGI